jgi:spoIIIJ-associated protein
MTDVSEKENAFRAFVEELFKRAGFPPEEVNIRHNEANFEVDVRVPDAGLVIGEEGGHLSAWAQVIKAVLQKFFPEVKRLSLDVNNYRAAKNEELRELARRAAREAVLKKKSVELQPMNAYERRIIHSELALRPDVKTESIGEEPERRVVVSPLE